VASSLRMAGSVMTTTTTTKDDNEVVRLYDEAGENASESTRTRFGVRRYLKLGHHRAPGGLAFRPTKVI
jgi:hypothetical protein